jgi:hypothetical protein
MSSFPRNLFLERNTKPLRCQCHQLEVLSLSCTEGDEVRRKLEQSCKDCFGEEI